MPYKKTLDRQMLEALHDYGQQKNFIRCPKCNAMNHKKLSKECWKCGRDLTVEIRENDS